VREPHRAEEPGDEDRVDRQHLVGRAARGEHPPDRGHGARVRPIALDVTADDAATALFDQTTTQLAAPTALVLSHTHGVRSGILDTTEASFDRHFAVNVRASWLLVREFCRRRVAAGHDADSRGGRIVALTSDHTTGNLPYGASKGALDRIVTAAGVELAAHGITGNVVNPGPTDTGWVTDELRPRLLERAVAGRLSEPEDAANLVAFLLSERGGWVNGQVLHSTGGWGLDPSRA